MVSAWDRSLLTQEFSEDAHRKKLDEYSGFMGPGRIEFEDSFGKDTLRGKNDTGFGLTQRFHFDPRQFDTPGTGTYNPQMLWEKPGSNKTCFEWNRGHVSDKGRDSIAPNRYSYKDPTTLAVKVMQRVTKRGPYDIFTGPRDSSTIKGHLAPTKRPDMASWPMMLPDGMDALTKRPLYGKFLKTDRSPEVKVPLQPGPGHYHSSETPPVKQLQYPFNLSSVARYCCIINQPGPGRYNHRIKRHVNAHTSAFRSKTVRIIIGPKRDTVSWFDKK